MIPQFKQPVRMLHSLPWIKLMTAGVLLMALGMTLLPSLFRSEVAVQISTQKPGNSVPDGFYVYQALLSEGIHIKSITPDQGSLIIKFESPEQSIAAKKVLQALLPVGFDIACQDEIGKKRHLNRHKMRT